MTHRALSGLADGRPYLHVIPGFQPTWQPGFSLLLRDASDLGSGCIRYPRRGTMKTVLAIVALAGTFVLAGAAVQQWADGNLAIAQSAAARASRTVPTCANGPRPNAGSIVRAGGPGRGCRVASSSRYGSASPARSASPPVRQLRTISLAERAGNRELHREDVWSV
jgi:hypothetical protein